MHSPALDRLKSDEFHESIGPIFTSSALRRSLLLSEDVRRIAQALRHGEITETMIRQFVSETMQAYKPGKRFDDDLALAAIAVVLEMRSTDFAEEYLHDLSRLRLPELNLSIQIARECLQRRCAMPKHEFRAFVYENTRDLSVQTFICIPRRHKPIPRPRRGNRVALYVEA